MNFQPLDAPRMGWSILTWGLCSQEGQCFIPALSQGAELALTPNTQFPKALPSILKHHPHNDALVEAQLEQVGWCLTLT